MRIPSRASRTTLLAVVLVGVAWACDAQVVDEHKLLNVTVADGETCGDIENEPDSIQATCDSGVDCVFQTHSYPDGGLGLVLGLCAQTLLQCPTAGGGCAPGNDCITNDNQQNICEKRCVTSADCPAPFQLCSFDHCAILACAEDVDCEDVTAHCSDRLCIRGDASTL